MHEYVTQPGDCIGWSVRKERCVHCDGTVPRTDRIIRGLCASCYRCKDVRDRYPRLGQRQGVIVEYGVGLGNYERVLPPNPTTALPGSEEKLRVLIQRAENEHILWHPDDPVLHHEVMVDTLL